MGLVCYKHNAHLVTPEIRALCGVYLSREYRAAALIRRKNGVKISDGVKGKSELLAAQNLGITISSIEKLRRKLKLNPELEEVILNGNRIPHAPHKPRDQTKPKTYADGWHLVREQVLLRDNYRCAICGKYALNNSVHHIDTDKHNSSTENLITLCYNHHMVVTHHPEGELNQICKFLAQERAKEEIRNE